MESTKMAQQMIEFQKTLFENSFTAISMILDQTEQMANSFLGQMPWITEDGRKTINESISFYKKARENFKAAVDEGFTRMDKIFTEK